jgi:hypothetical protein
MSVCSGQPNYGGGGALLILKTQILVVGVKIPRLVR